MEQLANATDQSSYIVKVEFTDESGDDVSPASAQWTLTDGDEAIVNSRDAVEITNPGSTVYVALSGDDLIAGDTRADRLRCLVVEGSYVSSLTGTAMPIKEAIKFYIEDLPQV